MRSFPPLALAVASAAFVACLTGIWDPDFFHHLAVGRALVRGTSFSEDPFLYPLAGQGFAAPPYWLGSVALHAAATPAGPGGAVILAGVLGAVLFALLLADALDGRAGRPRVVLALALLALAVPELRIRSAPRPDAFAGPLLAYTLLAVRRFELGRPRLLLAFPVVALVWAQLHVSVALGLGVVALGLVWAAVGVVLRRRRGEEARWRELRAPALVLAAASLATTLTPWDGGPVPIAWRFLVSTLGLGEARTDRGLGEVVDVLRQHVEELHAPSLADWATRPFGILVALAVLSFALHRSRGWGRELATVLAFAGFAASAFRFSALAAYVAIPIAARNLGGWLDRVGARRPRAVAAGVAALALAALALAARSPGMRELPVGVALDAEAFPVRAAAYLRAIRFDGRLYNEFGAGGYLEWALDRPVFQDGRGFASPQDLRDVLPEPVDPARMARLDARWRFDALAISTALPRDAPLSLLQRIWEGRDQLADRRLWSLVAFDDRAALYLRRDGRWAAEAARDEYRVVAPGSPLAPQRFGEPGYLEGLERELVRAAREAPACARCRLDLVSVLLQRGRVEEAAAPVAELLALDAPRHRPAALALAASVAQRRGDAAEAERLYREAIREAPEPAPLRRVLAFQLLGAGRAADAEALVAENLRAAREADDLGMAAGLARRRGDSGRAVELERELAAAQRRARARARTEDGVVLARAGRHPEALGAFRDAIAAEPGDAPARTHLGLLLLDLGEEGAALAELTRAVELDPGLAEAWFGVAGARERRGDRPGAATAYRRYLALQAGGPWAATAQARIEALERGGAARR
jgi:tetratricopeptide (TPR) repeat protein